jgi:CDP-diglyceride synthetase
MSRIITALVVLPVLIASILISWLQPLFVLLAAAALVLGLFEFYVLAKKRDLKPDAVAGYIAAAGLFVIFYITRPWQLLDMLFLIQAVLVIFIPGTQRDHTKTFTAQGFNYPQRVATDRAG